MADRGKIYFSPAEWSVLTKVANKLGMSVSKTARFIVYQFAVDNGFVEIPPQLAAMSIVQKAIRDPSASPKEHCSLGGYMWENMRDTKIEALKVGYDKRLEEMADNARAKYTEHLSECNVCE